MMGFQFLLASLFIVLIQWPALAKDSGWQIKTSYEKIDSIGEYKPKQRSVLVFKNSTGGKKIYKPSVPPFGLVNKQKIQLNQHEFFVTVWPLGAHTFTLRVFDPNTSDKPICEVITSSSQVSLRLQEEQLEVEKVLSGATQKKIVKSWEKCRKYKN